MRWFQKIFRRRQEAEPQPLRIKGVGEAPLTSEPDDAELAAQALLEHMSEGDAGTKVAGAEPVEGTAEYYHRLAERIRQAHNAARLRTMRFVTFVEQELAKPHLPLTGKGSLSQLEVELMKRIDTIERVGGDLKRRWQHCLADVTVRLMEATKVTRNHGTTDDTNKTETKDTNAPVSSD